MNTMKNLLSIVAVAFIMMLGTTSVSAQALSQDQSRPEVVAKTKVADMSKKLDLNGDQQRSLFRAYTAYEYNMKKNVTGKDISDPAVQAKKTNFDNTLKDAVKKSLTEEQYKKWLTMQEM